MNVPMVKKLMLKDWTFNRPAIIFYLISGVIALAIMRYGSEIGFHLGTVLVLTVLLGMGVHMTITTVVHERKEKTLPFIMSLPISVKEYTMAKVLANLLLFFVPWAVIFVVSILFVIDSSYFTLGLIPYVVILMGSIYLGYVLLVCVSLVSESMAWTVAGIIGCNLLLQVMIHLIPRIEGIRAHMTGATPVWNVEALGLIGSEVVITILTLVATFYCQSRKKDFT